MGYWQTGQSPDVLTKLAEPAKVDRQETQSFVSLDLTFRFLPSDFASFAPLRE